MELDENTNPAGTSADETMARVAPPVVDEQGFTRSQRRALERGAAADAERTREIVSLGRQYARYTHPDDVANAVERGDSVEAFKNLVLTRMESGHTDVSEPVRSTDQHFARAVGEKYSVCRLLLASVDPAKYARGAGFEFEASQELERRYGMRANGFIVPFDVLATGRRDLQVGTATLGGDLVGTDLLGSQFVEALRSRSQVLALGARTLYGLQGNVDLPRQSAVTSPTWLGETGTASQLEPTFDKVTLSPKRVGSYAVFTKQLLLQSAPGIEQLVRRDMLASVATVIDNAAINGPGTGNAPRGIRYTTGVGSVVGGTSGASLAWSHVVGLESACANSNATVDAQSGGYLVNSKSRGFLKTLARGTSLPVPIWSDEPLDASGLGRLNGYRAAVSNNVPANLTKGTSTTVCSSVLFGGDWSEMIFGYWGGGPDIVVDPYTLATTGQIRVTLSNFVDVAIRHAESFAVMDDALTS